MLILRKQQGAALAVSLIILLVMTLLVLSSAQNVVMQERMTSAVRDTHVSLAVAEAGISEAENDIETLANTGSFTGATGANGYFGIGNVPKNFFVEVDWNDSSKWQTSTPIDGVSAQYIIAHLGTINVPEEDLSGINVLGYGQTVGGGEVEAFQIVSRAIGKSGGAERMVMSYYGKKF